MYLYAAGAGHAAFRGGAFDSKMSPGSKFSVRAFFGRRTQSSLPNSWSRICVCSLQVAALGAPSLWHWWLLHTHLGPGVRSPLNLLGRLWFSGVGLRSVGLGGFEACYLEYIFENQGIARVYEIAAKERQGFCKECTGGWGDASDRLSSAVPLSMGGHRHWTWMDANYITT